MFPKLWCHPAGMKPAAGRCWCLQASSQTIDAFAASPKLRAAAAPTRGGRLGKSVAMASRIYFRAREKARGQRLFLHSCNFRLRREFSL